LLAEKPHKDVVRVVRDGAFLKLERRHHNRNPNPAVVNAMDDGSGTGRPRVITVDGNPSYPTVIQELKRAGMLNRRCRCRPVRYLNNIVEQDHRAIKRRINAKLGFRSFDGAWRTIQGHEAIHMIRKGQVRWLPKGDVVEQVQFIKATLGLAA
jgi:transposase, IS6 family